MKITEARVILSSPGRNFATLKITTDTGLTGLGDATLNGREKAVVAYLEEHVIPWLLGQDAERIEHVWQSLYKGAYWRRGPVTMTAIAAVDMALWDIKAKQAGLPLYQLLGGASRTGVTVYGHANGKSIDDCLSEVENYVAMGYQAVRLQCAIPGLDKAYGVAKGKLYYEPAERGLPPMETWSTPEYLDFIPELFAQARKQFGPHLKLLHDVHHRLTPQEAAALGKSLEPFRLGWLEDPTPADNPESFRLIRQHTTTPIATGEVLNHLQDFRVLVSEQLIDYVRTSVQRCGGLTHMRQIALFADAFQVRTGCHGATDLSPVTMGVALHFGLWVPNFGLQEYMRHNEETDAMFPHAYTFADGMLHPGEAPGHGVELDESMASEYPYQAASLPVAQLRDGTAWSW
ncbi:D-galactonate dehydratase family protein [Marinihelvus fidelis]|uniref:D-galactonate dehydratase family protein n=1 Tax=Marinihelvus fidelis TaxID=2613842 RepID=A0A5N0TDZ2_9GAMM|nr:D-mannonate dehydratase ManD [Marinihelvus fidelis]KAA9132674.1 D-galactonate dehydratase family protein [Marinihelvus fidelis]